MLHLTGCTIGRAFSGPAAWTDRKKIYAYPLIMQAAARGGKSVGLPKRRLDPKPAMANAKPSELLRNVHCHLCEELRDTVMASLHPCCMRAYTPMRVDAPARMHIQASNYDRTHVVRLWTLDCGTSGDVASRTRAQTHINPAHLV